MVVVLAGEGVTARQSVAKDVLAVLDAVPRTSTEVQRRLIAAGHAHVLSAVRSALSTFALAGVVSVHGGPRTGKPAAYALKGTNPVTMAALEKEVTDAAVERQTLGSTFARTGALWAAVDALVKFREAK